MIKVQHLIKHYNHHKAVSDISFQAKKGEIIGLLGPNGAGKTTTMRVMTGYLPPTSGKISIAGYDIVENSMQARQHVGYMPERVPIYPDMRVGDYVLFWARLRHVKNARARTDTVLRQFDLYDRRKMLVRSLSKGLRQRLGLAQTMVHSPDVIILDEPTIGIDPQQVIEVREFIHGLKNEHTVLVSSHILSEIEQICDRVIIMNKGQIIAEGSPVDLRQKMQPKVRLYVEFDITHEKALQILEHATDVEFISAHEQGFIVTGKDDKFVRKQIAQLCAEQQIDLLEMRRMDASLEDIFLSLLEAN